MSAWFPAAPRAGRPLVVGHRGVRIGARENTPEAFARAVAGGADWVELDARRSADGVPVVFHNGWLDDGRPVVECTADELAHVGVHRLDEILDGLPAGLGVDLEVKNLPGEPDFDPDNAVVEQVLPLARAAADRGPLLTSSFNPLTVAAMAEALPEVPGGFVAYDGLAVRAAVDIALEHGARALCPSVRCPGLDIDGIAAAHEAGLGVLVWTVNPPDVAVRLARAGADGLCGDDPADLRRILDGAALDEPGRVGAAEEG